MFIESCVSQMCDFQSVSCGALGFLYMWALACLGVLQVYVFTLLAILLVSIMTLMMDPWPVRSYLSSVDCQRAP